MCGIVCVISRPPDRRAPETEAIVADLDAAAAVADRVALGVDGSSGGEPGVEPIVELIDLLRGVDTALRDVPGITALLDDPRLHDVIVRRLDRLDRVADAVDRSLEAGLDGEGQGEHLSVDELERRSARAIELRDVLWAIRRDRLTMAAAVAELTGARPTPSSIAGYLAIQQAIAGIDRLEVRGRDSAGVHVFVSGHGLDRHDPEIADMCRARVGDPLFMSGAVNWPGSMLSIVYKAAAEIGELGDNTRVIRSAVIADPLLRRALADPGARVTVIAHTRWASVGIISEPNTHPLNSDEIGDDRAEPSGSTAPYVVAALNGDVDNHADLRIEYGLRLPGSITTDAKIIPTIVSRLISDGLEPSEAFRRAVGSFDGSVAIATMSADDPDSMMLALRGSGQGMCIGITEAGYLVASEPYGLVEETDRYLRMDGEHGGEIVVLDRRVGGWSDPRPLAGIRRIGYDGVDRPVDEIVRAEITTRDIDRGDAPHFLLKEISEAPESLRRTLRSRIVEHDGVLVASVGDRALPESVISGLRSGRFRRIRVIGQGTAAVAGQGVAMLIDEMVDGAFDVRAVTATELSGFQLRLDMSDTLAIAVSQSGTTTDTNRTVDLIRSRGAAVIGIVNRRNSDLVDKSDGVLYTSDGRDVEMSVASTKAFYAQIAAGALLGAALADVAGVGDIGERHELLSGLRQLPDAMMQILRARETIADIARRFAPSKRYWALVGNGPNRVAAEEIRIKLSELCYKSIACDNTEDKKHIDLSSEPLVLVCAAGLVGSTGDDVAKETAIFRAHKAVPVVIADEGETRYAAAATITVPSVHPRLGFVLSAMAGHLFGYEAARAIDATAVPLRAAREVIERAVATGGDPDAILQSVISESAPHVEQFNELMGRGDYDGQLEARTAVMLNDMMRDLGSGVPVEEFQRRSGRVADPAAVIDDLVSALTRAIEELTRPIDAIKHQAKTVTVGISRSDEGVLDRALVQAVIAAGVGRERLTYRVIKVLADLDPAVEEVIGYTRYAIDGEMIEVIDRGGISRDLPSRVERSNQLVGTKHRVAAEREVLVARGRSDGRTVVFVPEVKAATCTGITLVHVRFRERVDATAMRTVLQGYDRRYERLVDWVTETEGAFDDSRLGTLPVVDLLTRPISEIADLWRVGR